MFSASAPDIFAIGFIKRFVTMPFQEEHLFQIIMQGSVSIYVIRDDGSVYSLANSTKNDLLGEMEIFLRQPGSVYAKANEDVTCLAVSIEKSRDVLLENCQFLQLICESLTRKMESVTTTDAAPAKGCLSAELQCPPAAAHSQSA